MSLNKKSFLLGGAAAIFLAIAIISLLNLRVYPNQDELYYAENFATTSVPTQEEASSIEETTSYTNETVIEPTNASTPSEPAISEADSRMQYARYVHESKQTVKRLRFVFYAASFFAIVSFFFLIAFVRRTACREGIETNLVFLTGSAMYYITRFRHFYAVSGAWSMDPTGKLSVYGTVNFPEMVLIVLICVLFVWTLWTLFSWFAKDRSANWCLICKITENKADSKNSLSLMILFPAVGSFIWLSAAAVIGMLAYIYSLTILYLFVLLCVCETLVCLHVLSDRMKAVRVKQQAIVEEAKISERMRVDLIANVSHDLRTPLTSIIGYGELLKKEDLSEDGRNNLNKLNEKSGYLREMVDAVFDLAKVSSGVQKCGQDEIDLNRLLEQTIGDYIDALQAKGFEVRRHYAEEHVRILSDGIFLHQIFANLLSNAIKYTMPGTRIYVQLTTDDTEIVVRMMNVASYEMKFTEEEILERFARGDESRNTEGNGLGLAIAKTYSEALSGSFRVKIDGDLFIAIVSLPASVRIF